MATPANATTNKYLVLQIDAEAGEQVWMAMGTWEQMTEFVDSYQHLADGQELIIIPVLYHRGSE